jgi:hypothetical protein
VPMTARSNKPLSEYNRMESISQVSQGSTSYQKGKLLCKLRKHQDAQIRSGCASARLKSPSALSQQATHLINRSKFENIKSPDVRVGPNEESPTPLLEEEDRTCKKPRFKV